MMNNENPAPAQEFGRREFLKKGLLWGEARHRRESDPGEPRAA